MLWLTLGKQSAMIQGEAMSIVNYLVEQGALDAIKSLYMDDNQLSPNTIEGSEECSLVKAVGCKNFAIVEFFMTWNPVARNNSAIPGTYINAENLKNAMVSAIRLGQVKMVQYFMSKAGCQAEGALDANKNTALHIACMAQQHAVVIMLLALPEAVELTKNKNAQKQCPLHLAAVTGHEAITAVLFEKNVRAKSYKDDQGETPLTLATLHDKTNIVSMLTRKMKKRKRANDTSQISDTNEESPSKRIREDSPERTTEESSDGTLSPWSLFLVNLEKRQEQPCSRRV